MAAILVFVIQTTSVNYNQVNHDAVTALWDAELQEERRHVDTGTVATI